MDIQIPRFAIPWVDFMRKPDVLRSFCLKLRWTRTTSVGSISQCSLTSLDEIAPHLPNELSSVSKPLVASLFLHIWEWVKDLHQSFSLLRSLFKLSRINGLVKEVKFAPKRLLILFIIVKAISDLATLDGVFPQPTLDDRKHVLFCASISHIL